VTYGSHVAGCMSGKRIRAVLLLFQIFALAILAPAQQSKLVPPKITELKEIKDRRDRHLLPEGTKNLVGAGSIPISSEDHSYHWKP
jgi:hypothetical protein